MRTKTFKRRSAELLQQIQNHPHKDELVNLMLQQIQNHPHKDELLNIMLEQLTDSNTTYTIPSVKTI